jgi:hypothetical protein
MTDCLLDYPNSSLYEEPCTDTGWFNTISNKGHNRNTFLTDCPPKCNSFLVKAAKCIRHGILLHFTTLSVLNHLYKWRGTSSWISYIPYFYLMRKNTFLQHSVLKNLKLMWVHSSKQETMFQRKSKIIWSILDRLYRPTGVPVLPWVSAIFVADWGTSSASGIGYLRRPTGYQFCPRNRPSLRPTRLPVLPRATAILAADWGTKSAYYFGYATASAI